MTNYYLANKLPENIGTYIALDIETSGLLPELHKIVGLSLSWAEGEACYIPVAHDSGNNASLFSVIRQLNELDKKYEPTWIFYNAKGVDLKFLEKAGFIPTKWRDVSLYWYVYELANIKTIKGLKALAKAKLGVEMTNLDDLMSKYGLNLGPDGFGKLPLNQDVIDYACADADMTRRLLFPESLCAISPGHLSIINRDHELVPAVMDMESHGVHIDMVKLKQIKQNILDTNKESLEKFKTLFNRPDFKPNSPKQLAEVLYNEAPSGLGLTCTKFTKPTERHPGGSKKTNKEALKLLSYKYKKHRDLLLELIEYKELKTRAAFCAQYLAGINPSTDRVYPQYHMTIQETGRLSSTGDGYYLKKGNLQGVPKLSSGHPHNIRAAFIASPGYKWVSFDLSNIEIRLIANFSGDTNLIGEINKPNGDLHTLTAKLLFGKTPKDPDFDKWRKIGKICNFNLAYAFGTTALRQKIETETGEPMSKSACEELFYAFFEAAYPGWGQFKKDLVAYSRRTNEATTLFGRPKNLTKFYKNNPNAFYGCAGDRQAVNHPIQGSCADLLRRAITEQYQWVKENSLQDRVRLLLSVHDELNFEIRDDQYLPAIVKELQTIFEWTPEDFPVRIKAVPSIGDNWGQLEEIKDE